MKTKPKELTVETVQPPEPDVTYETLIEACKKHWPELVEHVIAKRVSLTSAVRMMTEHAFIDRIECEELRIAMKSLQERGVWPWCPDI